MTDSAPNDTVTSPIVSAPSSSQPEGSSAELSNNPGSASQPSQPQRRRQKCRFYASNKGCRAGDACPFYHDITAHSSNSKQQQPQPRSQNSALPNMSSAASSTVAGGERSSEVGFQNDKTIPLYSASVPSASRVVARPVPRAQVEDPRAFQLAQVQRRFKPKEVENAESTLLILTLVPSDPDFPFEIAALDCTLSVPKDYPGSKPNIMVTNKEMGRGFQINVETGFDAIVESSPNGTLLQYLNALDKQLEQFLAAPKAETVKLIVHKNKASAVAAPQVVRKAEPEPVRIAPPQPAMPKAPVYSSEQLSNAQSKREQDMHQLEARLGRLPQFSKAPDGHSFVLPLEPRKRSELPISLQAIRTVKLVVPPLYSLEPCRIELQGVYGEDVRNLQDAFRIRASENSNLSLMAHVNYLSQNMHIMAVSIPKPNPPDVGIVPTASVPATSLPRIPVLSEPDDRSHIITIPRPPEWSIPHAGSGESDSDDFSDESDEDESEYESEQAEQHAGPERGIAISFPHLELYGIEILELSSPSITIKCTRCKTQVDVTNLKNSSGAVSDVRNEACKKCGLVFGTSFRMDLMHANSVRAGYFDLDGCTVVDLLPSTFLPTCSECSTRYPAPGIVSVRGESSIANCRECHKQLNFRIPEVKFLQVSAAAVRASRALPRKKKENLGIVAGQELPRRGRCSHYAKSYRWFRFSCCSKVYACDRCHDVENDHPVEHANRMICGFCSREQNYRPEDCGICHSVLVGKKGSGFWEGGKGTRDRTRMSRKDPRKFSNKVGSSIKKTKK